MSQFSSVSLLLTVKEYLKTFLKIRVFLTRVNLTVSKKLISGSNTCFSNQVAAFKQGMFPCIKQVSPHL